MKKTLFYALTAGAGLMFLAALNPLWMDSSIAIGSRAPDFRLPRLEGGLSSLSDYSGRIVLINFWATWCKDCREEMPALERLYLRHKDKGLSVVAVSLDEDGRKSVAPFVSRYGLSYPVLLADGKTARSYGVLGLPTAYLLDKEGLVLRRYVGSIEPEVLENDILKELERRKPS